MQHAVHRSDFRRFPLVLAIAVAVAFTAPASAQKSKDTLRMAFLEATQTADPYLDPKPETNYLATAVFDSLVVFDETRNRYEPLLAKAWKWIDSTTLELELRNDVKWQDGQAFDADDAVHTISYLIDPKVKLRFKHNWSFIAKVEKLGAHKVKITTKQPTPNTLAILAYETWILPEHLHSPLADKMQFGIKAVGTGMYKLAQIDRNTGAVTLKNPGYKHGGPAKPASNIGRVEIVPVPDFGTQTAHFLRGDVHLLRNVPLEQAEALAADPKHELTLAQSIGYLYMSFDAAGRSGLKPLQDVRVRKALMMAVKSDDVFKIRTGNRKAPRGVPESLCWKFQNGCGYTKARPPYDPPAAKKLLAEAGYAGGFDIALSTFNSTKDMAEVVAGQMREIGVRASVDGLTFAAYRKKQSDGKLNSLVSGWSAGGTPDVSSTLNFFFEAGPRDYFQDTELHKLAAEAKQEMDDAKRRAIVTKIMDKAAEQAYAAPVAPIPLVFLHVSELKVANGRFDAFGIMPSDLNWK